VCNWRHNDPASVGNNLGVISKLHMLTNAFTRRCVKNDESHDWALTRVTEKATLVVARLQCVNNVFSFLCCCRFKFYIWKDAVKRTQQIIYWNICTIIIIQITTTVITIIIIINIDTFSLNQ
jgi:hypothetical protein